MSKHTSFLYEPKRGTDESLDKFLDQQRENQLKWRKETKSTKAEAEYAYAFLQWCDALSLVLCMNHIPPEERRLEVSKGPDNISYYVHERTDGSLSLDPWPFDAPTIDVHVESFQLAKLVFKNDKELYNTIQDAPAEMKTWTFRRQ